MDWKPIASLDGLYEASSEGEIRSVPRLGNDGRRTYGGKVIKPRPVTGGYLAVTPSVRNKVLYRKVARLVCEAFHGPPPTPSHHAAHRDGNRQNNRPENLRWLTGSENEADKIAHGTALLGERAPAAKLSDGDVVKIRNLLADGATQLQVAQMFGVSQSCIGRINTGESWRHI